MPLIAGKEFIIEVKDEVTLNYIISYVMRGHGRVVKFSIVLQLAKEVMARHIKLKKNNMMIMMK